MPIHESLTKFVGIIGLIEWQIGWSSGCHPDIRKGQIVFTQPRRIKKVRIGYHYQLPGNFP